MGLFDKFRKKEETPAAVNAADNEIVAIIGGETVSSSTVTDEMFAQEMLGKTAVFKSDADTVTVCAPANGTLPVMFPTGHAFGLTMNSGAELLVHIGVNTVNEKGNGFTALKKQGEAVKAGDPVVKVDLKQLRKKYDMSIMLIVTNPNGKTIEFKDNGPVKRGEVLGVLE